MARIRYEQSSSLLAEEQRELSEQEEQQLELLHHNRLADLVVRQCATALKSVVAHKVCCCSLCLLTCEIVDLHAHVHPLTSAARELVFVLLT